MQIYLARNNVQAGPYTLDQLNTMLASGEVILNDLIWHEGMENWQRLGDITNNQYFYAPNGHPTLSPQESHPHNKRVTVAELYGNKAPSTQQHQDTQQTTWQTQQPSHAKTQARTKPQTYTLASIASRVLAVLIDQLLAFACILPVFLQINNEKLQVLLNSGSAQQLQEAEQILSTIPQHLLMMTAIFTLLLFIVQIFLLIRRGQTLGKLILGIRILDFHSKKIPSITNIILIRLILTNIAYSLPAIGPLIMIADFIAMVVDPQKRSLHDKLAKTYVVKADESQIETKPTDSSANV